MVTRSISKLMLSCPKTTKSVTKGTILVHNPLDLLPDELLTHIISFLSLSDIGMLCLTGSSLLRERAMSWIFHQLLLLHGDVQPEQGEHGP